MSLQCEWDQNQASADDLRPEYDFDYSQAKPNRFAHQVQPGSRVVVLDPDIAESPSDDAAWDNLEHILTTNAVETGKG